VVRRHLDLVHSAALRQVRSPQLAEEVAQSTFLKLAQHARQLAPGTVLSAWLYQVTRREAIDVVRREARRLLREQIATEMNAMNATAADWTQIEPLLDEAMHALEETDRAAVLLRYFENKSLREVGEALGSSENAAQKRLTRAVERLREFLADRGVTASASAVVLVVSANAVQAGPVGLATSVTSAALGGVAGFASKAGLFQGLFECMAGAKAKAMVVFGAGAVIIGAAVYQSNTPARPANGVRLPVGTGTPKICIGGGHGIILTSDGSLWSWGENYLGWSVLGQGKIDTQSSLRRIGMDNDWIDVSSSFTHCLALKSDGTMWGWGENLQGQLGTGSSDQRNADQDTPHPAASGNDWKQVAAGGSHSLGLKTDGTLWGWGLNASGQLGVGLTNATVTEVTQVGTSTNWVRAWAAGLQSVGQQSDGSLWFWGSLTGGGDTNHFLVPTRISLDTNWVDVSFGFFVVFAIKDDGTLWCWGRNAGIYTGAPIQLLNPVPRRVGTNSDWKACATAEYFYRVLQKNDGSLWELDASDYAFFNKANYRPVKLLPVKLRKNVAAFGAAGRSTMGAVLTKEGEFWTWGKVLGEYTPARTNLQALAKKLGWKTERFEKKPVMRKEPWLLPIEK
jgi:RNA polymerase sigma factor (sigma-70 family)